MKGLKPTAERVMEKIKYSDRVINKDYLKHGNERIIITMFLIIKLFKIKCSNLDEELTYIMYILKTKIFFIYI